MDLKEERKQERRQERMEESRILLQAREKLLFQMIERDAVWQTKTNRLNKVVAVPEAARETVAAAVAAFEIQDYATALHRLRMALAMPSTSSRELWDNCGLAALLLGHDEECLAACAEALKLDPNFVPALLHKARAERGLQHFDAADRTLATVLGLRMFFACDVQRERQLLQVERRDRETGGPPMPDLFAVLGVPWGAEGAAVTHAYRRLAMKCHPDKWVTVAPNEQQRVAHEFQAVNEAYATLQDLEARAAWQDKFEKQQLVRSAPHRRTGGKGPSRSP